MTIHRTRLPVVVAVVAVVATLLFASVAGAVDHAYDATTFDAGADLFPTPPGVPESGIPNCNLNANPDTITAGQGSTLTATCTPKATSYA